MLARLLPRALAGLVSLMLLVLLLVPSARA
jgi:hypothetical protein